MKSWVNALKVFQRPIGSDECKIFSALLLDTSAFESQKMSFRHAIAHLLSIKIYFIENKLLIKYNPNPVTVMIFYYCVDF